MLPVYEELEMGLYPIKNWEIFWMFRQKIFLKANQSGHIKFCNLVLNFACESQSPHLSEKELQILQMIIKLRHELSVRKVTQT